MTDRTVTPLRPRAPTAYTDTAALNDIHALLTAGRPRRRPRWPTSPRSWPGPAGR